MSLTSRVFGVFSCFFGLTAVGLGAYARHGVADPYITELYEIGVLYQFVHALALLVVAWLHTHKPGRLPLLAGSAFISGIVLFAGTLYLSPVVMLIGTAPAGGWLLMAGWTLLGASFIRK